MRYLFQWVLFMLLHVTWPSFKRKIKNAKIYEDKRDLYCIAVNK